MTSIKVKFRASTIPKREGVIYFQLIHSRKVKLITTRFKLFADEWDEKKGCVKYNTADSKRQKKLHQIKKTIVAELKTIEELVNALTKQSHYSVYELAEYYVN